MSLSFLRRSSATLLPPAEKVEAAEEAVEAEEAEEELAGTRSASRRDEVPKGKPNWDRQDSRSECGVRSSQAAMMPPTRPPTWPIQLTPGVPGIATSRIPQYSSPATTPTTTSTRFRSKMPRSSTSQKYSKI